MLTIGQFAKVCKVTIKAIRYYEKIGLLSPAWVDDRNQYRYYTSKQADIINKITLLKEMGIPLKSMEGIIKNTVDQEEIGALLVEHRKSLIRQLELCNNRLAKLGRWRKTLDSNELIETGHYDIYIEDVPATIVRSSRRQLEYEKIMPFIMSSFDEITSQGGINAGPPVMLIHGDGLRGDLIDVEVACPVDSGSPLANKILPAIRAAKYIHVGPYDDLQAVYESISVRVNQEGYQTAYPLRGIFHTDPLITPPERLVIEINLPIDSMGKFVPLD